MVMLLVAITKICWAGEASPGTGLKVMEYAPGGNPTTILSQRLLMGVITQSDETIPASGLNENEAAFVLAVTHNVPILYAPPPRLVELTAAVKLVFGASVSSCQGEDIST